MPPHEQYDTRLDNKYGYLTVIDVPAEVRDHEPWFNQTLTRINDSVLRLIEAATVTPTGDEARHISFLIAATTPWPLVLPVLGAPTRHRWPNRAMPLAKPSQDG